MRQLSESAAASNNSMNNTYQNDSGSANSGIAPNAPQTGGEPTSLSNGGSSEPYQLGTLNNQATTAAGMYDEAFSYLQRNDYSTAQIKFQDFINNYPDDTLVANAKYWLGETYYARGEYQDASRAFARAFKDHPDGQKAPDTLLKLAMSLNGQNMTQEACLTLTELTNRFPNASSAVKSKTAEEQQAYGCN